MTLPAGFGGSTEHCYRCTEGHRYHHENGNTYCDNNRCVDYDTPNISARQKLWEFEHYHETAYILIIIIALCSIPVGALVGWLWLDEIHHDSLYPLIEAKNCKQLTEYIADKDDHYSYAEHRYEWLCVNEQVKEFT